MTKRVSLPMCLCLLLGAGAWLRTQPNTFSLDYRKALAGYIFRFPRDHGSHPDFKLEWWYYTGHLQSDGGRRFGYELVFFRTGIDREYANPSRWKIRNLYMAHFAVTDIENRRFHYFEKLNRSGPGIAGSEEASLDVWNENWSARLQDGAMRLRAAAGGVGLALQLTPQKPPVIHGRDGISRKGASPGQASHYYSLTRLESRGTVTIDGRELPVSGQSWMDHEFGTNQLADEQVGWNWFSLQLDGGDEVMLFRLRRRDGGIDPHSSGTLVFSGGRTVHLDAGSFAAVPERRWTSPVTATTYPISWTLSIASAGARLRLTPVLDDQELVTTRSTGIAYWEGAVDISGTWMGKEAAGKGYVELTGYAEKHRPDI